LLLRTIAFRNTKFTRQGFLWQPVCLRLKAKRVKKMMVHPTHLARSSGCLMSPAFARMKGMFYLDEMRDVVDFGVATSCDAPIRLAIQRSEIKIDGSRKRWNGDKVWSEPRNSSPHRPAAPALGSKCAPSEEKAILKKRR